MKGGTQKHLFGLAQVYDVGGSAMSFLAIKVKWVTRPNYKILILHMMYFWFSLYSELREVFTILFNTVTLDHTIVSSTASSQQLK